MDMGLGVGFWPSEENQMPPASALNDVSVEKKERRRNRRYNLSLPASVSAAGQQESVTGRSRDVSTSGAYLVFDAQGDLVPGTELDLTLTLPKEVTSNEDVQVRAHGKTVRVDTFGENGSKTLGIAVVFERHHFVRAGSTTR